MSYSYKCYSDTKDFMKKFVNAEEGAIIYGISKSRIIVCIFRKNCASVPEERSAIPLQTEQSSAG